MVDLLRQIFGKAHLNTHASNSKPGLRRESTDTDAGRDVARVTVIPRCDLHRFGRRTRTRSLCDTGARLAPHCLGIRAGPHPQGEEQERAKGWFAGCLILVPNEEVEVDRYGGRTASRPPPRAAWEQAARRPALTFPAAHPAPGSGSAPGKIGIQKVLEIWTLFLSQRGERP
jgi:hypothetical protein